MQQRWKGEIEVICGGMFSGKTEELIRRVRRAQIARQEVQVFKPRTDDRAKGVASHNDMYMDAIVVEEAGEILKLVDIDTEVVAIDEGQFFDWTIADVCDDLANNGLRVIIAGLDMDSRGEPFGPMPLLMAIAEKVDKLQAICVVCGAPASRTYRLVEDDAVVRVGGLGDYEARCRHCHQVPKKYEGRREPRG